MALEWGPRGYPGATGLSGTPGQKGDKGDSGPGVTVTDNGDGTYTIRDGYGNVVTVSDGYTPQPGIDYFPGNDGNYRSYVFAKVPNGSPVPTITDGTGSYDGITEVMPTGSVPWAPSPSYDVGYTVYVSTNSYRHTSNAGTGTWALVQDNWSTPIIYNQGHSNQLQLTAYSFKRDSTLPSTPSGGSYNNPNPTTAEWYDGIPAGTVPIYMSKRIFTSDGLPPQENSWSTPVLLGGVNSGTKFMFGPTASGPWYDMPLPPEVDPNTIEWMILCTQNPDGTWDCNTDDPIKIKGEEGSVAQSIFKAIAYKRSASVLTERPLGGSYDNPTPDPGPITGWTNTIPQGTADLYVSERLFTTDGEDPQDALWSESVLFSGASAKTYSITSDSFIFAYDGTGANPVPTEIIFTANKQNIEEATTWSTNPPISFAAEHENVETFTITAAEFGQRTQLEVIGTAGDYSDSIIIIRVQDGAQGAVGEVSDTREVRFQYAPAQPSPNEDVVPGPSDGSWHARPLQSSDIWMREGVFINNVLDGSWSAGTRIVGNDGADTYTEFYFAEIAAANTTPTTNPELWGITQDANDVLMISRTITNGVVGPWGEIIYIRGDDGVDGKYFETQFAVAPLNDPPQHDADPGRTLPDYDKTAFNPLGWTTNPNLPTEDGEVIWAITATKNHDNTLDTEWNTPAVQWGAYTPVRGQDYNDGIGAYRSKIYKSSENQPTTPTGGTFDGTTETVPSGWSDDPMSPEAAGHYVWESSFLYISSLVDGVATWPSNGGPWSEPVPYAYIPTLGTDYFNGTNGDGSFRSYVFTNVGIGVDLSSTPPIGGSFDGTTEVFPDPNDNNGIVWEDNATNPSGDEVTWVSQRTYRSVDGVWQTPPTWSDPIKFTALTALAGTLTNSSVIIAADSNGDNYQFDEDDGGEFLVYFGVESAVDSCVFYTAGSRPADPSNVPDGTFAEKIQEGLKVSINVNTGVYSLSAVGANGWESDREIFTLVAEHAESGTILTKRFTVIKSRSGAIGISGTANRLDIAYRTGPLDALPSYPATPTSSADSTGKTQIGTNVVTWVPPEDEPPPANLDTDSGATPYYPKNASNYYEWTDFVGSDGEDGLTTRIDFAYADALDGNGNGTGNIQWPSLGSPATPVESNKYLGTNAVTYPAGNPEPNVSTNPADYEWSRYTGEDGQDGQDGKDALTILNYNPNVTLVGDANGNINDYTNTGTTIRVFSGEVELAFTSSSPVAGQFYLSEDISDVNILINKNSAHQGTDGKSLVIDDMTGLNGMVMSNAHDRAFATYEISGLNLDGNPVQGVTTQVFSKTRPGDAGISVILSNSNHTIPTDSSGNNPVFDGSGTTITVLSGDSPLVYAGQSNPNSVAPGTWKLIVTGIDIVMGGVAGVNSTVAVVSDATSMTTGPTPLTAKVNYTIIGRLLNSNSNFSLVAQQSFTKGLAGANTGDGTISVGVPGDVLEYPTPASPTTLVVEWRYELSVPNTNQIDPEPNSADVTLYKKEIGTDVVFTELATVEIDTINVPSPAGKYLVTLQSNVLITNNNTTAVQFKIELTQNGNVLLLDIFDSTGIVELAYIKVVE